MVVRVCNHSALYLDAIDHSDSLDDSGWYRVVELGKHFLNNQHARFVILITLAPPFLIGSFTFLLFSKAKIGPNPGGRRGRSIAAGHSPQPCPS